MTRDKWGVSPPVCKVQEVVVANIRPQNLSDVHGVHIRELVADGRQLPFGAGAFDWVFSNAVIEHVGSYEDQVRFATEVRRVAAKGYFVASPYKKFPIEPHTLLPLYQFLSKSLQQKVAPYSPGYLREYEEINLLIATELQQLFPEARVHSAGLPIFGNSIVACYRNENSIA
jgi:ubiquinone/menaquinone biosynthesis C-methylase UbiE